MIRDPAFEWIDMATISGLPLKLELLLAAFNLSRARLAQKIGVDKSIVSRWVSGGSVPSEHNLSRLTDATATLCPGFGRADWSLDEVAFRAKLGVVPTVHAGAETSDREAALFLRS